MIAGLLLATILIVVGTWMDKRERRRREREWEKDMEELRRLGRR